MSEWESLFYQWHWGIAQSLRYPLYLSPLIKSDNDEICKKKINLVARYLDIYCVRRSVNFKLFGSNSISYTINNLIKEIRHKSIDELHNILKNKLDNMDQDLDGILDFRLTGTNKIFIKYMLSRITAFLDKEMGYQETFSTYFLNQPGIKHFEVEHIWANDYSMHDDEYSQLNDFEDARNSIGGLLLLPRGTNQSYGALSYEKKMPHYIKENILAKSLNEDCYKNNPNFVNMLGRLSLDFKPHQQFKKVDLYTRQKLIPEIARKIWTF